jgi:predicted nucleotidyltransferase component of viral defense system
MAVSETYRRQVALLIRLLPLVTQEESFALKGGTAINLFIRNLPRLSVDIDLTYLPIKSYEDSLRDIDAAMKQIETRRSPRSCLPDHRSGGSRWR